MRLAATPEIRVGPAAAAVALAAICALGLGVRLTAIDFGFPGLYHPDEIPILNVALGFATLDLNPHRFLYPTLYYYALFAWEALYFAIARIAGVYPSVGAFQRDFFADPTRLVLVGRTLTTVFGVATLIAAYRFGSRLYDRATGIGAALLLAVAPFAVRDAHYVKHDVPATFFMVATMAALATIVVDPAAASRRRSWLVTGALSGLAMSTHWYAIAIVVPIIVAALIDVGRSGRWQTSFGLLVWAGVASVAGFFAASPFMLVEWRVVVDNLLALKRIDIDRAVAGAGPVSSLLAYVAMFQHPAMGWSSVVLGVCGLAGAIWSDWRRGIVLASLPVAFFLFLTSTVPVARYTNPMLPSIAVAASWVIARLAGRLAKGASPAWAAMLLVAAVPGTWETLRLDAFFAQTDTRSQGLAFVEREIADGATILIQPYSVSPRVSREGLREALTRNLGSGPITSTKFNGMLAEPVRPPAYRLIYLGDHTDTGGDPDKIFISTRAFASDVGLRPLREMGVEYVILKGPSQADRTLPALEAALGREARLLATFSPFRQDADAERRAAVVPFEHNWAAGIDPALDRPGPTIRIWRINP